MDEIKVKDLPVTINPALNDFTINDLANGSQTQKTEWSAVQKLLAGWLLDGNTNGAERYIGTNDAFDLPVRINAIERARFTAAGITLFDGAIVKNTTGNVNVTWSSFYDVNVDNGGVGSNVDDDFLGFGINLKSSTIGGIRVDMGIVRESLLGFIPTPVLGFIATETRIRSFGIPTYANDAAAGAAGLMTGDLYKQNDGAGGFNMKIKS